MRFIFLFLICLSAAVSGQPDQTLILGGYKNDKEFQARLTMLEHLIDGRDNLKKLLERYDLKVKSDTFDQYRVLTIETVQSIEVKNALKIAFSDRYPHMFFINSRIVSAPQYPQSGKNAISNTDPSIYARSMDNLWIAILLLSIIGLFASVMQRKKIYLFKEKQFKLRTDQERVGQEMEAIKGEMDE